MSKSNTFETDLLDLIFTGTAIADLAENDTTAPLTDLYLSLHTADPGEAGDQTTNECAYTSYARKSVARTGTEWTVAAGVATLANDQDFVQATGGTETATHFAVGTAVSGTGKILYSGTVTPNISISNGTIPRLSAGSTITED